MAKLTSASVENTRLEKRHLELIAYCLREMYGIPYPWVKPVTKKVLTAIATQWAKMLEPHVRGFKRDLFIRAVVEGTC